MSSIIRSVRTRIDDVAETMRALIRMHQRGVVDLTRPDKLRTMSADSAKFGPQATLIIQAAARNPDGVALADERGELTFRELDAQSSALARALLDRGLPPGAVVGVLARDHRGLLLTMGATGKAGLRLLLLNTGSAKPQLAEVITRENVRALLYDSEFSELLSAAPADLTRMLTWTDDGADAGAIATVDELVTKYDTSPLPRPAKYGGIVVLTSGTSGLPKGAPRTKITPLLSAQFVDRVPYPRGGTMVIVSPLFHGTGAANWLIGMALLDKTVLMRRFDPEKTLQAVADHEADMLVAVPTMMNRILALGPGVLAKYDTSSLKVIMVAGSALSPELSENIQDAFGDVLYNLYGSTEVAIASVATPVELRTAPGTVGRSPLTCSVALFDENDNLVDSANTRGRIFVRSATPFEGYTDGRHKQIIDGYMSTGDMGRIDEAGLLFVDGRDDDMIVSGGENVYPQEVENLLAEREDIFDVAVIGVDDPDFGKRLRAFVVPRPGAVPDPQAIKDHVKANLARYKVPRDVVFVEELPRNATGKILRRVLNESITEGT